MATGSIRINVPVAEFSQADNAAIAALVARKNVSARRASAVI